MTTSYPTGGGFASQNSKSVLIGALQQLPQQWQLTPVGSNKAPYRTAWQSEKLDRQAIAKEIKSGKAKGYGLLTGPVSGGLLAVDADGLAAHELLARYGELPPTVAFSSGRPGRCQYLLRISPEYWDIIKTVKINTGVKGDDGKDQLLELRWDGCQSVLPPSVHPTTGCYKWVSSPESLDTAECPIWLLELILNSTPAQATELDTATVKKISVPVPASIPLEMCLAKSSRHLLSGVNSGGRNNAGAKLARDLIGTANHLRTIGQAFDGDPQQLLEVFGGRCSPPLPAKEVQTIWKSAERSNATPACTAEGVETCVGAWYWNNYVKNTGEIASLKPQNNIISHAKFQTPSADNLEGDIEELFEQDLKRSQLKIKFAGLAQKYRLSPGEVEKIYRDREQELEQEADREDVATEVARLLDSKKSQINISEIIPPGLAAPIAELAAR
ncbi:MAG: bifunctional DNA primase/polymerase, partial [Chroococcidiopsis sp.]